MFYTRLFEINPVFKTYFPADMKRHGVKFRLMINTIVLGMDNLVVLKYRLQELGRLHAGYRLKRDDYRQFIEAFLWTLKVHLSDTFTRQVEDTWRRTLLLVMDYMLDS
jgi:hemoglobin-like flavoprotein